MQYPATTPATGLLSLRKVMALTGFANNTLHKFEQTGRFPRRHRLSHKSVVYRAQDIAEFLEDPSGWIARNGG